MTGFGRSRRLGSAMRELVGGRKFTLTVDPSRRRLKDPETSQSSARRYRASTFRQRSSARSPSCRMSSARHAARARGAPAGGRRALEASTTPPQDPRFRPRRAQRQLPGSGGRQRMGRHPGVDSRSARPGPPGRGCPKSRSSSSTCATQSRPRRSDRRAWATPPTHGEGRREEVRRPTTSPFTRTARSAPRARSPSSRTASSPSGRRRRPPTFCASSWPRCSICAGARALHLCRRRRLLRPQRLTMTAAAEAALIAKAVGRPVRVQWMRADEHGWDPKGPPTLLDLRATLDDRHRIGLGIGILHPGAAPNAFVVPLLAATLAKPPTRPSHPATLSGLDIPYTFANSKLTAHWLETHRSGRPGSGRRAACRTPSRTKASSTKSLRRPASIRSRFG